MKIVQGLDFGLLDCAEGILKNRRAYGVPVPGTYCITGVLRYNSTEGTVLVVGFMSYDI